MSSTNNTEIPVVPSTEVNAADVRHLRLVIDTITNNPDAEAVYQESVRSAPEVSVEPVVVATEDTSEVVTTEKAYIPNAAEVYAFAHANALDVVERRYSAINRQAA